MDVIVVGMAIDDLFRLAIDEPLPLDVGDDSLLLLLLLLLLSLFLFGFGGKAGRNLSNDSDVDVIGVELMFGATACIRGLGMVDLTEGVIDVGATLLIGFLGGTTKFPDGI